MIGKKDVSCMVARVLSGTSGLHEFFFKEEEGQSVHSSRKWSSEASPLITCYVALQ